MAGTTHALSVGAAVETLSAFVPRLAPELAQRPVPSWTSVPGSMLSADISGFTALSEKLAGKGKAGAEEITALVNTCFTALIDAAYQYGGEVLKFGGDALLILFRGENHQRRAADAGLLMQWALHTAGAAKRANLSMTVGVADGPFDIFLVGSGYRELLVSGPRASEVIRLEGAAVKGETLVAPSIASHLPAEMHVREQDGGMVITGSTGDAPTGPAAREHFGADLSSFVPQQVIDQLAAFDQLGGEHRLVTVGFVMVTGVAGELQRAGPVATALALSAVVDGVVDAALPFGVTPLHTDIANDGVKFVLCAGAPVNPGDTADAMLQTAIRISEIEAPFTIRQGVQTGRVFAGFLGSDHRKTYTLMGDPVNTAARMLGKALDREIVAVESVVLDTRTVFITEPLEPFLVKGKTEPITAHKVRSATGRTRRDSAGTRLFGRSAELEVLAHSIGELGAAVELVGTAGVGKSRLLDAAWDEAEGLAVYQGACTPYGAALPYSVFRPLLRGGLGIPVDADARSAGKVLTELVTRRAPQLLPMLPLLAVPFGAAVGSTTEVDTIDPAFRRARIHDVVVQFFDSVLNGPAMLVVEDAHWIDDASGELISHLVSACAGRPWMVLVTRRPEGSWHLDASLTHARSLVLQPLEDDAIRQLALATANRSLTDGDLDSIAGRAAGNPLFAVELARSFTGTATELPDTIEQIIAIRLDQLPPSARRLLRFASVLGAQFDEEVVAAMLHAEHTSAPPGDALQSAAESGAITPRSGTMWTFSHALYRDAAYTGLPFSRRKRLHRLAAGIIEARSVDVAAAAPLLSLHYSAARAHEQAWHHSLVAASAAEAQHATNEAAVAYERALAAGRYCTGVTADDRTRVAEQLGDLYYELGRPEDALRALRLARRLSPDRVTSVRLMRKVGSTCERQGRPDRAARWYARAGNAVPEHDLDRDWLLARADVALAEAGLFARRGDNDGCLRLAREALADAERADDHRLKALALERMHLAIVFMHQHDTEATGPRALGEHRRLDDHSGMARTLINLGIGAYFGSEWTLASTHYLEALEIAQRAGNVVLAATAALNSAEVLSDQGDWEGALSLLDNARRNYEAVGYRAGVAASALFSSVALTRLGRYHEAVERQTIARSLLLQLDMMEMLDDLDSRALELDVVAGRATREQCVTMLDRFGAAHPHAMRVLRCRGMVEHRAGDSAAAQATLCEALAIAAGDDYDRALTLRALLHVAPGSPDAPAWHDESEVILRRLGVHALPPLPSTGTADGTR